MRSHAAARESGRGNANTKSDAEDGKLLHVETPRGREEKLSLARSVAESKVGVAGREEDADRRGAVDPAENPARGVPNNARKHHGCENEYRLRVGDWRVLLALQWTSTPCQSPGALTVVRNQYPEPFPLRM
jgi:hypothetical protein